MLTVSSVAFHTAENGCVFGPRAPNLLHRVCLGSTPLYCRSDSGSVSLHSAPCGEEEQHSVASSQDSGIPTLELSSPEGNEHQALLCVCVYEQIVYESWDEQQGSLYDSSSSSESKDETRAWILKGSWTLLRILGLFVLQTSCCNGPLA